MQTTLIAIIRAATVLIPLFPLLVLGKPAPLPTAGALAGPNQPTTDTAPQIQDVFPANEAIDVPIDATLTVTFSEPVALASGAVEVQCEQSGEHILTVQGGDETFTLLPETPFWPREQCVATVFAMLVSDLDNEDPPDLMLSDYFWSFTTGEALARHIVINELDAITATGLGEFLELYDGGSGYTNLDGLVVVFYDGDGQSIGLAVDLDGYTTGETGHLVIGTADLPKTDVVMPDGWVPDGPAAAALYAGDSDQFPPSTPLETSNLLDAVVYDGEQTASVELLGLLYSGEASLNENSREQATTDSNGRCPDGAGGQRQTSSFQQAIPTPGEPNSCTIDTSPAVLATDPQDGQTGVALEASIHITFTEPVILDDGVLEVACIESGRHDFTLVSNGYHFEFLLTPPLQAGEPCVATIFAERVHDLDTDDPPDIMNSDYSWQFTAQRLIADHIIINEVDSNTPGNDKAEFIELFDGGIGNTSLDGLALVLFNGFDDQSYKTISLEGYRTNQAGYFLLGNAGAPGTNLIFPNGLLQNGPDAIALVVADGKEWPVGTAAAGIVPLDAVVYGPATKPDAGLLGLLNSGEPQVDEGGRGNASGHSSQRCPNGVGGGRNTRGFKPNTPTPGYANDCLTDSPPAVQSVSPAPGATDVDITSRLVIEFAEPVALMSNWLKIECRSSGSHTYKQEGGPAQFLIELTKPLAYNEECRATIWANRVSDADNDDPPDIMANNYSWRFFTSPPPADFVVINEIDTDTPGSDIAEFIELFDGGIGNTSLRGLTLVLFNGNTLASYRTIDLNNYSTNPNGYLLVGNAAVNPDIVFANSTLQNGPDAVALYQRPAAAFPNGSPLSLDGLLDAVVYGKPNETPDALVTLLAAGQQPVDENSRGAGDIHALQRCPNGLGGQQNTSAFLSNHPTPGLTNNCLIDAPPAVIQVTPADGASDLPVETRLIVTFSESVRLDSEWLTLNCDSGRFIPGSTGGPKIYQIPLGDIISPGDRCVANIHADRVRDRDMDDPPDTMTSDFSWQFSAAARPVADFVLINEIDTNTPSNDKAEFIELYDGGIGQTDLTGLVLVFWNGNDDLSYRAIDLEGYLTDEDGFFVVGNRAVNGVDLTVGNGSLQNGPDAVTLYAGRAADFPTGSRLTTRNLLDAIVYGPGSKPDRGLLTLLASGQPQVDENGRGWTETDSLQRCPDGSGGQRHTETYYPSPPTPGSPNRCITDEAPTVLSVSPTDGAIDISLQTTLSVTFNEEVGVGEEWLSLECSRGGPYALTTTGGPYTFYASPAISLPAGDWCIATIHPEAIYDLDNDDPPNTLAEGLVWTFRTQSNPPPVVNAAFTHNGPLWIGQEALFQNTSQGPEPLEFSWDFGDGSPFSSEIHPTHIYSQPGLYTVKLTVRHGPSFSIFEAPVLVKPHLIYWPVLLNSGANE